VRPAGVSGRCGPPTRWRRTGGDCSAGNGGAARRAASGLSRATPGARPGTPRPGIWPRPASSSRGDGRTAGPTTRSPPARDRTRGPPRQPAPPPSATARQPCTPPGRPDDDPARPVAHPDPSTTVGSRGGPVAPSPWAGTPTAAKRRPQQRRADARRQTRSRLRLAAPARNGRSPGRPRHRCWGNGGVHAAQMACSGTRTKVPPSVAVPLTPRLRKPAEALTR
jgi:hypothetical protein